ncbi:hypothetical protein HMPREF1861_00082 [Corynebacterium kroppenstedtii]|nr:hypothetical protein HMPREF1861_00082 [Corynebacterium kroppenstedtii]
MRVRKGAVKNRAYKNLWITLVIHSVHAMSPSRVQFPDHGVPL